jgi:ubiquinone/menaquinone biosynthesis C-methylase UbiE
MPSLIDVNRIRKIDESDMRDSLITMLDVDQKNYVLPEDWDTVEWDVFDNRAERRMNKVLKYVNNDGVHLDIGCGRGDGVALIGRKKLTIGIDFGIKSCLIARNLHPHIIQADVAELPFPDTYFDSITILDVMEHILEPKRALDEMKRVLKTNGILVLQTPSLESDKIKAIGRFLFKFVILPSKPLSNPLNLSQGLSKNYPISIILRKFSVPLPNLLRFYEKKKKLRI